MKVVLWASFCLMVVSMIGPAVQFSATLFYMAIGWAGLIGFFYAANSLQN